MPNIPNRQWKYVIVDSSTGEITGTDDEAVANEHSINEFTYVINMSTCQYNQDNTTAGNIPANIPEQKLYNFDAKQG